MKNKKKIIKRKILMTSAIVGTMFVPIATTISCGSKNANEWHSEGMSFLHKGKFQDALECFNKAIEKDPKNYNAYIGKYTALTSLGRFQEATKVLQKAVELGYSS